MICVKLKTKPLPRQIVFPFSVYDHYFVISHGNFVVNKLLLVIFLMVLVISKLHFFSFPVRESYDSGFQDRKQTWRSRNKGTL